MRAVFTWRALLLMSAGALGGAAGPAASGPTDLSVPMFTSGAGDPYSLTVAPTQNGPAGTVTVTQTAPPAGYSFEEFKENVHGYVSTGVSSRGGYGVDGGLLIPVVPGRAELEVGGGTGQTGSLFPKLPGYKNKSASVTDYYAALHVHPSDDVDITIGYSGANLKLPQNAFLWGPAAGR